MTTSDLSNAPETRIVEMVFPNQARLFGGDALRLMDMAAFVAASRHARKPVVTASSERIDFHVPVRQSETGGGCGASQPHGGGLRLLSRLGFGPKTC